MISTTGSSPHQRPADWRRVPKRQRSSGGKRTMLLVALPVLLFILGVTGFGYYGVYIAPLKQPVVRVNDTVFTMADYLERLRYWEAENKIYGRKTDYSVDPFQLLDDFRDNELIREGSPRMGATVTDAEITQALKERLDALPKEGEQATDEEVNRRFQELYKQRLSQVNLSDAKYRQVVTEYILKDKLREILSVRVPAVAEQVHVLVIKAADDQGVQDVQKRLNAGEDFGAVAKDASQDEETKSNRGDLGWLPRRALDPAFDDVAFTQSLGTVSQPFWMQQGFWIIKILEREAVRKVEGTAREKLKDRALQDWLDEEQKQNRVERYFDSDRYEYVLNKLKEYRRPDQNTNAPVNNG